MTLTKDSKKTLYILYKEYCDRRKHGFSKSNSKNFVSAEFIHENFFPDSLLEDVEDSLRELGRCGYLDNTYADDTVYICHLSDYAIATLEELPKETLLSIADFISKFIP
ncbi:MAG: hypothetical protein ACI4F1_08780 [Bariatricus sp.]